MDNQKSKENKWSLFQAFCCGPKSSKKKTATQSQPTSKVPSPRQQGQCNSIIQRNTHINNQTGTTMRQTVIQQESNLYEDEENSSYSSRPQPNQFRCSNQNQYQSSQFYNQNGNSKQLFQNVNQMQQQSQLAIYAQQNNIINIKSHHQRHSSQQEASHHLEARRQQLLYQKQQQQIVSMNYPNDHRRAISMSLSNNVNQIISNEEIQQQQQQQLQESQVQQKQPQQQMQNERMERLDTYSSQNSIESKPYHFYTMSNQFFQLKTRYAIHEIDFVDTRPSDKAFSSYFTFDCPICFRHFNRILKSSCCDHYLCHYCLRDIYNKAKDSTKFEYRCMFCQSQIPEYVDADDSLDKIKRYSDSPFATPKDNTATGDNNTHNFSTKPFSNESKADCHNIHNNLIEFQEDNSMEKENVDYRYQNEVHIINNCSSTHFINKHPLPHLLQNNYLQQQQQQQQSIQGIALRSRDKNISLQENENVIQSAHKPAGLIPEFQNKYHCNYLQHNQTNLQQSQQQQQQQQIKIIR